MSSFKYAWFIMLALSMTTTVLAVDAGKEKASWHNNLSKHKLAFGIHYTGIQLRWGFLEDWAAEARFSKGKASNGAAGETTSRLFGLRGYYTFLHHEKFGYYAGLETGRADAKNRHFENFEPSGYTLGAFAGLEYYILPQLSLGLDLGPYYISLKDRGMLTTNIDIVANSFINWYFF